MCRYMYIYFSNCSHQTFILLDCCSAADVRTVVDECTIARKALKVHSGREQKYSHSAPSLFPPKSFHKTINSSSLAPNECEQSIGQPNIEKSVDADDNVSRFRTSPPLLYLSNSSQNVASDHSIGNALLLRSSRPNGPISEEGDFNHELVVSSINLNTRLKIDRSAPHKNELSSSMMHDAVVLGSGLGVLGKDQHTRSSSVAPTQSQRYQRAARIFGVQCEKSPSGADGSTPSEQLLIGNNNALMSTTSQRTDYGPQHSICDNGLEEHSGKDEVQTRSSATDASQNKMTWAARVQAGGSKGTIPRISEQRLPNRDLRLSSAALGSSPPRLGFPWGPSEKFSVAPASDVYQELSPPADNRALSTMSSIIAQTSRSKGLGNSQSNKSLPSGGRGLSSTSSSSYEPGGAANRKILQAQGVIGSSDETARIHPSCEVSDKDLKKSSQPLARIALDGTPGEEDPGSEWHVVVRKRRVLQTARSSKATKSTRRKTKALKRQSQSPPAAPVAIQNTALVPPTPKISPSISPRSSFSPTSDSMPTLLKPSYAAVASLRSPVISSSSSTTSSADATFFSAPQSPEHVKPELDILLGSPVSSENYFSAPEDLEEECPSPTENNTSERFSGSWEAPAAIVLAETDHASTSSAQASRGTYDKQTLAAEEIGPKSPISMTDDTALGWTDQDRSIVRHLHSTEHSLQKSAAESLRVTESSRGQERKLTKGVSYDPLSKDASTGTSRTRVRGGSSNAPGTPTSSQDDGRVSNSSDPSQAANAAHRVFAAGTGSCRNTKKGMSSQRNRYGGKPISFGGEHELRSQEVDIPLSEKALLDLEGISGAPEPKGSERKTSKRSQEPKVTTHNSKPDASTRVMDSPISPKNAANQQVSPLSVLTSSPKNLALSPRQDLRSASTASQKSTRDVLSGPDKRWGAGGRVTREVATGVNMPREDPILRAEAPEFTPQTTPSKSQSSYMQSPASLHSQTPEGWVQQLDPNFAAFAPEVPPLRLQSVSNVSVNPNKAILMPWMSIDFWLPKNTGPKRLEPQCALVRNNREPGSLKQPPMVSDLHRQTGQIRRLKPCGFIQVEQAVEQIGSWCPRCNPDH